MRLSKLFLAASAAVLLAACQPAGGKAQETKPETAHDLAVEISKAGNEPLLNVPHAQLPDTVTPRSYRVDMMIDPQEEGMSGTVAIDVTVAEAADRIWISIKMAHPKGSHLMQSL